MEFPLPTVWYERNVYTKAILLKAVKKRGRPSPHHQCSASALCYIEHTRFQPSEMKFNSLLLRSSPSITKCSYGIKLPLNSKEFKNVISDMGKTSEGATC